MLGVDNNGNLERSWFSKENIQEISNSVNHYLNKLQLVMPNVPLNEHSRFLYAARRTRIYGRDSELGHMRSFVSSKSLFSWMSIVGAGGKEKVGWPLSLPILLAMIGIRDFYKGLTP
jgi:hypothetical protein